MRKSSIAAVVLASFVGVFGALQLDHHFSPRADSSIFDSRSGTDGLFKASYNGPSLAPAPFDFAPAAKRVSGSVVSVDQYIDIQDMMGGSMGERKTGTGSGVIISDGLIVTNNHVVQVETPEGNVPAKRVVVRTNDNHSYDAKVLGTDARSDLAVLQVSAKGLPPIETGQSSNLAVGQWVIAVGNPLNLGDTVTVGVISSLNRDLPIGQGMVGAIQTDAAINPGNSGGALCDAQGRLIGINAAIESGTGQSIGIGFAIPVERVKQVVSDIVKYGYVKYAAVGISYNPNWDDVLTNPDLRGRLAQMLGVTDLPDHGVVVMDATGAAASSGIAKNDVIESIDGVPVNNSLDMNKATIARKPGDQVKVAVWSHGHVSTKTVTMQELPHRESL